MAEKRKTLATLSGTRIYKRYGSFQYYAPEPIQDPKTGKLKRWHILCPVSDGETRARLAKDVLLNKVKSKEGNGDFPFFFQQWRVSQQKKRDKITPKQPERMKIWQRGSVSLASVYNVIEKAFRDFDVSEIRPAHVAAFIDQWEGQRSAQTYRSHLSTFFHWCIRKELRDTNPAAAELVPLKEPPKRKIYITNEQYCAVYKALLIGKDKKPTRSGPMVQCYMDLCYLLHQRTTDVRLCQPTP